MSYFKIASSPSAPRNDRRGFILLLTLIFMTTLVVIVGSMMYMVIYQTRSTGSQTQDCNMEGIADAGIERAHRAIRDDYLTTTATGVADLRGATATSVGSTAVANVTRITYVDGSTATLDANGNPSTLAGDVAQLKVFDSNYTNTKIISVFLCARANRANGSSSPETTLEVSYSTTGAFYQTGSTRLTQPLPNNNPITEYAVNITSDRTWTWGTIMDLNFTIRAVRTQGTRNINLDAVYLRVTYGIDTLNESWATGSYASFPVSLSGGTIQSIAITDEASKVHLNYASQSLLTNLFTNLGVASASTKATNVVNYRGASLTNPFDSVEELQQVSGITAADYAAVKDYVTVYSFVNPYVYRPAGPRAPVNINTSSFNVLKSVFDSLGLTVGDSTSLANAIITFRGSTPFTCFYSSNAAVTTDFYDFLTAQAYLTATERDIVRDNCDPSSLIPTSGYAGYSCTTTELCYAGGPAFQINTLARVGTRNLRVKTLRGNDGSRIFSTYATEPSSSYAGWRKENFE